MPRNVLCIPPYPGELGWEIVNYVPYVNGIRRAGSFDLVLASVRNGRERLYPFVSNFMLTNVAEDMNVSGNSGPAGGAHGRALEEYRIRVTKIRNRGNFCRLVKLARVKDRVLLPGRKHVCYKATEKEIGVCHSKYGLQYAVIAVRTRKFGRGKNWSIDNFDRLGRRISELGFVPVYVGSGKRIKFSRGISLVGKTTVSDVIPILCGASFAVGGSTGTLHLASMCKTPHFVWGNKRLIRRYRKDWNPFDTKVRFMHEHNWRPPVKSVVVALKKFIDGAVL